MLAWPNSLPTKISYFGNTIHLFARRTFFFTSSERMKFCLDKTSPISQPYLCLFCTTAVSSVAPVTLEIAVNVTLKTSPTQKLSSSIQVGSSGGEKDFESYRCKWRTCQNIESRYWTVRCFFYHQYLSCSHYLSSCYVLPIPFRCSEIFWHKPKCS